MTPKEIIQLATVLQSQAEPLLRPHRAESPRLLGNVLRSLSELPGLLEVAFDEVKCLEELATETKRQNCLVIFTLRDLAS